MISGITKNVALKPLSHKDLDDKENFLPNYIDLRNGFLSNVGNWTKRSGYSQKWDVGVTKPIDLLIPESTGYAVVYDENGNKKHRVFKLGDTILELTGQAGIGNYRPTWVNHNGIIIICDGYKPIKISEGLTSLLGGSPPSGKYCARINNYTVIAGQDDYTFAWCDTGLPEVWTGTNNSGSATTRRDGQKIMNIASLREKLYIFKEASTEVWIPYSSPQFVRQDGAWINKGLGASYSLVQANDSFYWFGNDGDFYVLDGIQPRVISISLRSELDKLVDTSSIYGFDFRKESLIRWFAPTDGRCFVYDYVNNRWSEDNTWGLGQFNRLPIHSYMELNNKAYFGDYDPTGKIFEWSPDYKDDNGQEIRVYRKFALIPSPNGHRVRVNRIGWRLKRGVATSTETNPLFFWRYRVEGGNWSNYVYHDMGSVGDHDSWIFEYPSIIGREFEIEIVETDAVDYLLTHMNLTVRELSH